MWEPEDGVEWRLWLFALTEEAIARADESCMLARATAKRVRAERMERRLLHEEHARLRSERTHRETKPVS